MLFEPIQVKNYTLKNKIIMAPMCMYQSDETGHVKNFHRTHYMSHAMGGVSMVIVEATSIMPNGRISLNDLGIWSDDHIEGLRSVVEHIHEGGALSSIQINHAGRKTRAKDPIAPSALTYSEHDIVPKEMTLEDIKAVISAYKEAARRANLAGFDGLEIHAAHGYLLSQFMSPISNQRTDKYGHPSQMIKEVIEAVCDVWPQEKILTLRISGTEYHPDGFDVNDVIEVLKGVNVNVIDFIHVSSGGNIRPLSIDLKPGYQLELSKTIKSSLQVKTIGGGLIHDVELAQDALINQSCDMVFFGRLLLRDPMYFLRQTEDIEWPKSYIRGKQKP
jgi:NADPH2 dehydrogenase